MTKETPRGIAGNARRDFTPLRDWGAPSYSSLDGRACSSLSVDQHGKSPVGSRVGENLSAQIPSGFEARDRRATTDPRPVRTREFTKKVV